LISSTGWFNMNITFKAVYDQLTTSFTGSLGLGLPQIWYGITGMGLMAMLMASFKLPLPVMVPGLMLAAFAFYSVGFLPYFVLLLFEITGALALASIVATRI